MKKPEQYALVSFDSPSPLIGVIVTQPTFDRLSELKGSLVSKYGYFLPIENLDRLMPTPVGHRRFTQLRERRN